MPKGMPMTIDRNGPPAPRIIPVGEEPPPMDAAPARPDKGRQQHKGGDGGKPKGKPGERFAMLNAFVDFALSELSRAEIAVWLVLYRDTREGTARTSYDDLARRTGLNRRNVGRAVRRLEDRGLVKVIHRGGLRKGVSRYRVRGLPKDR
jgi:DNA-binding transcriptional ArsR family regulator